MKYFFVLCFISLSLNIYYAGAVDSLKAKIPDLSSEEEQPQRPEGTKFPGLFQKKETAHNAGKELLQKSDTGLSNSSSKEEHLLRKPILGASKIEEEHLLRKPILGASRDREPLSTKLINNLKSVAEEGNKEAYNTLLEDLKNTHRLRLSDVLLLSKDNLGNHLWPRLLESMIKAKTNQDFFNKEMIKLLSVIVLSDLSHFPTKPINSLIKSAKDNNNLLAFSLLSDFSSVVYETRNYLYRQKKVTKNQLLKLLEQAKYNTSYTVAVLYIAVSTALTVAGYKALSASLSFSNFLSSEILLHTHSGLKSVRLAEFLSPELLNLINNHPERIGLGAGAIALGVAGLSKSALICRRAFRKKEQIKKLRR